MELAQTPLVEALSEHIVSNRHQQRSVLTVGINGAQGSGKSTLASALSQFIGIRYGMASVCLSLDDFYLTKAERLSLAKSVHPLCAVRGVPGTHDVALARETLAALGAADDKTATPIPRFDKLNDDRMVQSENFLGQPAVIFFEGWCVGALPQRDDQVEISINALERDQDPEGTWRRWANHHLAASYMNLWSEIDTLIFIQVPDLSFVIDARLQQEKGLAAENATANPMSREDVTHFVAHYERLTRHIWATMPGQADIMLRRDQTGFSDLRYREN